MKFGFFLSASVSFAACSSSLTLNLKCFCARVDNFAERLHGYIRGTKTGVRQEKGLRILRPLSLMTSDATSGRTQQKDGAN